MIATRGRLIHWIALTGLLVIVTIAVLVWSSHGLSYPNPADIRSPVSRLGQNSERDRSVVITRYLLLCLDSLSRGKMDRAIASCDAALGLDPKNVTAFKLRGNANLQSGRSQQAVADFTRAIRISTRDAEAYRFRAGAYSAQHQDRLALADYSSAMALTPDNTVNFQLRGYFYQIRNHYRLAIADFSTAIAMQPRLAAAWNSRCWTRAVAGIDLTKALADCNRALELAPANANAWDSRGLVYLRMGRYRAAIADYSNALAHSPRLATSLFGRGAAKLRISDRTAYKDIAAAKAIEPGIEVQFLSYGVKLRANGPSGT
jgi:tetratricopeptide (TPR) repeat protein